MITESECAAKLKEFMCVEREASKILLNTALEERNVAHRKREDAQKEIEVLEAVSNQAARHIHSTYVRFRC